MGSPGGVRWAWPNAVRPPGSRTSPPYPVAPAFDGPRVRPTPLPARLAPAPSRDFACRPAVGEPWHA